MHEYALHECFVSNGQWAETETINPGKTYLLVEAPIPYSISCTAFGGYLEKVGKLNFKG